MKCKQCKYVKVCMAQADMLGQVFDVNYDGEHGCTDFTPFTNADRIRAMSDEELINLLSAPCPFLSRVDDKGCSNPKPCRECIAERLKQPAEEEA